MRHRKTEILRFAIISDLAWPHRLELRVDGTANITERETRGCGKENNN